MKMVIRTEAGGLRTAGSFTCSAAVHGSVLAWVALAPLLPKGPAPNVYDQVIRPNANRIVWYNLKQRLPEISPAGRPHETQPPRAVRRAPQTLVAGKQELLRPPQLIWAPAPEMDLEKMLPSPNVVAVARPVRPFRPPPEPAQPARPKPALPDAPQIAEQREQAAPALPMARPQPRAFTAPDRPHTAAATPVLAAAPELTVAIAKTPVTPNVLPPLEAARRTFIPPVEAVHAPVVNPVTALPAAPEVAGSTPAAPRLPAMALAKPVRPFTPPVRETVAAPSPPIPEAPPENTAKRPAETSLAIVGLFPTRSSEIPAPRASQQAGFSAGPQRRTEGTDAAPQSALLEVPGLLTHTGNADAHPVLMASLEAPTSRRNLLAAAASVRMTEATLPGQELHSARAADLPDARLRGRAVYTMSIQMPNVTSFSGSWLVWFAAREPAKGQPAPVQAPTPVRKVDPKYIAAAAADRVEGKVRLAAVIRKDGRIDTVELLQHLDSRLDQSAQEALAKWEFEPAVRNGSPIDVDAVFEIPFHLAPRRK